MEELFRFSVVRPVTISTVSSRTLAEAPQPVRGDTGGAAAPSFQAGIATLLKGIRVGEDNDAVWARLEPAAATYLATTAAATVANPFWAELLVLTDALAKLADPAAAKPPAEQDVTNAFTASPTLTEPAVAAYAPEVNDLFLASLIARRKGPAHLAELMKPLGVAATSLPALADVAARVGACAVVADGAATLSAALPKGTDPAAALLAALTAVMHSTLLLPPALTAALHRPTLSVGLRELHVVKQAIRRYETSEISRIENVLKGETRDHHQKHTLSTEQDTFFQTTDTSETDKELDTNDRTSVKTEADSQVKDDTKLDGGVHAQYSSPSFKLQTDLTASYQHSDDEAKKYAAETAKEITQKAVSKVTTSVTRSQTSKIIETFEDREQQKFTNDPKGKNISGVYQWLEKVYLAQTFNLGRHLLIDLTVPEPAANLLAMATSSPSLDPPPIQPHPLGKILSDQAGKPVLDPYGRLQLAAALNPLDIAEDALFPNLQPNPNFYGTWVATYGATSVDPPPRETLTFSKGKTFDYEDNSDKTATDTIPIDDGYEGTLVLVSITAMRNDDPGGGPIGQAVYIDVSIGGAVVHIPWPDSSRSNTLSGSSPLAPHVTGNAGFTIYGRNIDQMSVNVEIVCSRSQSVLDKWKLETYEKIAAAYRDLQLAYDTAMAARKMATQTVGPLGSATDPDQNRLTERIELKRSSIAILDNSNPTVAGTNVMALNPTQPPAVPTAATPQLPEPMIDAAETFGGRVRWFEQAFEWENMAYVLYPYYWGRRELWLTRFTLANQDPDFLNFLQAGYARVVVPVRLGFELAVLFYLNTGLPWLGGDLPPVGDNTQNPLYLDVAEEIKALTGGGEPGETETPVGDPWEFTLPTTIVKLRPDDQLPEWHRIGADGKESSALPSDAPSGLWSWRDGAPTI